jgi:hypothetical protein
MIYYLVTERHAKTVTEWLTHFHALWSFRFTVLPYEKLGGWLAPGVFIFSDYERLTPNLRPKALLTHRNAVKSGCTLLNDPRRSLRRYDLQKRLNNDFRVFRPHEIPDDLRYPVFLREENEHRGTLTPLLDTREELDSELARHRRALTVEYLDTADKYGFFRKYAAFRIGDHIIPRHVLFSRNWMQKMPDIVTGKFVEEELDFVRGRESEEKLRAIFEIAECDYGRIDYGLKGGAIQVWEINSNPQLIPTSIHPARGPTLELSARRINDALTRLDSGAVNSQRKVWCG